MCGVASATLISFPKWKHVHIHTYIYIYTYIKLVKDNNVS